MEQIESILMLIFSRPTKHQTGENTIFFCLSKQVLIYKFRRESLGRGLGAYWEEGLNQVGGGGVLN